MLLVCVNKNNLTAILDTDIIRRMMFDSVITISFVGTTTTGTGTPLEVAS